MTTTAFAQRTDKDYKDYRVAAPRPRQGIPIPLAPGDATSSPVATRDAPVQIARESRPTVAEHAPRAGPPGEDG